MCDQEHAESAIRTFGLKSAPAYIRAWRQLRIGLELADSVAALCEFDAAHAWVISACPNANTRHSFIAKCLWPFEHVSELADHPARNRWRAVNDEAKSRRMLGVHAGGADFDALATPQSDGHGGLARSESTSTAGDPLDLPEDIVEELVERKRSNAQPHQPHQLNLVVPAHGDYSGSESEADFPIATPVARAPSMRAGAPRLFDFCARLRNPVGNFSFAPMTTNDAPFACVIEHERDLASFTTTHGDLLSGVFDTRMVRFSTVEWSGLRGTIAPNRLDLAARGGQVVAFAGPACDAPIKATALAFCGSAFASEDALARSIVTRQVCASDPFKPTPRASLHVHRVDMADAGDDDGPREISLTRQIGRNKPAKDATTQEYKLKFNTPTMLQDGVKSKLDAKKWKDHLQSLGVHSPLFDVDGAINALQRVLLEVQHQPIVKGDIYDSAGTSLCSLVKSFAATDASLAHDETAPDTPAYSKSACKRRRLQARRMRSRVRENWTDGDIAAAASLDNAMVKEAADALKRNFVETLSDRASMYLAMAAPGNRVQSTPSGLTIVDASGVALDPRRVHLTTYYAVGFAAHAALCEARAPSYNGTLVVLDDIPSAALHAALAIFGNFVKRNRDHVVLMACPEPSLVRDGVSVVSADTVNELGLARFLVD